MKAKLLSLDGKYYGTKIAVSYDGCESLIEVWHMGNYKPSARELRDWNEVNDGPYETCDSHFESESSLEIAERIVKALND